MPESTDRGWFLECSGCAGQDEAAGVCTVCPRCDSPYLVRYRRRPTVDDRAALAGQPMTMWRYRPFLPLRAGEQPITLGEGGTPLIASRRLGKSLGLRDLWIKDEAANPTGSFKARGLSAAVTRAVAAGVRRFVIPTAGNAGLALAAYGARADAAVRVYAPRQTPPLILEQIRCFGAELVMVDGHIGDCGRLARAHAEETLAMDFSTLREPYRIEGKKSLGFELAEQFGWRLPGTIIYPTGGGTGLIGMWKAFEELISAGWVRGPLPRLFAVQSAGCAPVVAAFEAGHPRCEPWAEPRTVAAGLLVPSPFGGPLALKALRATAGGAVAVSDAALLQAAGELARLEGVDASPEGGATVAALGALVRQGRIAPDERVVVFNTGAGVLYRRDLVSPVD